MKNASSRVINAPAQRPLAARARGRRRNVVVSASSSASSSSSSEIAALIAKLRVEAGTANGTDRTDAQREVVADVLTAIETFNEVPAPARVDLTGTDWELLYTDSSGNSSGKIGPFLGRVTQVFASSEEAGVVE